LEGQVAGGEEDEEEDENGAERSGDVNDGKKKKATKSGLRRTLSDSSRKILGSVRGRGRGRRGEEE